MQEIIVRKFLQTSRRANIAVVYEPKVRGRSGATHKVEFVFYQGPPMRTATIDNAAGETYEQVATLQAQLCS